VTSGHLVAASASDIGRTRQTNEDAVVGVTLSDGAGAGRDVLLLAIADGMGGMAAGEVASSVALASAERTVREHASASTGQDEWVAAFGEAFARAVAALRERAGEDEELGQMGTTLTCVVLERGRITFAHMGDSRAYLYRDGTLRQLTTDHNAAAELVSEGRLTAEQAGTHKSRFVLTRWLAPDTPSWAEPECGALTAQPGDVILVCSDGLHGMVPEAEIAAAFGDHPGRNQAQLQQLASALVAQANEHGGKDNISVALGAWTAS
jgi:protein phosphatase